MGIQCSTGTTKMMKSIVFAALVAAAYADADADAYYSAYGYGFPTPYYGQNAFGYSGYPYSFGTYEAYPVRSMNKRSADAEADADHYYSSFNYGSAAPFNNGFSYETYSAHPFNYGPYNYGSFPFHAMGKRSADAEADADQYYSSYGYGYAAPFNGYNSYAYGAYPYGMFNTYGSFPFHAMGKRSADADADVFYSNYGYAAPYGFGSGAYSQASFPFGYRSFGYQF